MNKRKEIRDKIIKTVANDINPSSTRVAIYLLYSFGVGGALSLLLCGQCGLGLSPIALKVSHEVHSQMHPIFCAIFCGGFFSIIPIIILKYKTHPLFFKALIRKDKLLVGAIIFVIGLTIYSHSNWNLEILYYLAWCTSAYFVFHMGTRTLMRNSSYS